MNGGDWSLPPLRAGYAASPELVERRARAAGVRTGDEAAVEREIGGVRCLLVNEGAARTMLYLHGGGYRMGSPVAYLAYTTRIAVAAGMRLVMPFYRLAPEHPFPAGLHDTVAVYRVLAMAGAVTVGGDSAGAGLAAALCIAAHQAGAAPAAAVLVSPMLDLEARDATFDSHAAGDIFFSRATVLDCAALYLQGAPADAPLVSPLNADPTVFPPVLLLVGGSEVLLGETTAFARKLALADRRVTLHVAPGMGHVWPMLAPGDPASAAAVSAIAVFVSTC